MIFRHGLLAALEPLRCCQIEARLASRGSSIASNFCFSSSHHIVNVAWISMYFYL